MPPSRKQQKTAAGSLESGGEAGGDGGAADDEAERAAKRAKKALQQKENMAFAQEMWVFAKDFWREKGLDNVATEGVGDCWLIGILGGVEGGVPKDKVAGLTAHERGTMLTNKRKCILTYAESVTAKAVKKLPPGMERIGVVEFKALAYCVGVTVPENATETALAAAAKAVRLKLIKWAEPRYWGRGDIANHSQTVRMLTAWYMQRSLVEICTHEMYTRSADSARCEPNAHRVTRS